MAALTSGEQQRKAVDSQSTSQNNGEYLLLAVVTSIGMRTRRSHTGPMAIRASSRASLAKTLVSFYLLASRLGIDGAGHIQIDYTGHVPPVWWCRAQPGNAPH
uniref:Uncharacterized protein n=1 Tax=Oryza sativa subsp. japonica TaxID=39947 RepID=Q6Z5X5_ORYSJ|nr:hypothetical protein [Oryza sativa Japonica Group]